MEHTRRHTLPAETARALREARVRRGLSLRGAASKAGIAFGYLGLLERGARAPSVAVARELIDALHLEASVADRLLELARDDAGRCSPWRSGSHAAD